MPRSAQATKPTKTAPRPRAKGRTPRRRPSAATKARLDVPPAVGAVFDRMGRALSAGDLPVVASCFAYPSLLLTGADTHEFRDPQQVQEAFRKTVHWQGSVGIVQVRPEIESATSLGAGIHDCTVRWPAYDAAGRRIANERGHYIVQGTAAGAALIRAAVVVAADEP